MRRYGRGERDGRGGGERARLGVPLVHVHLQRLAVYREVDAPGLAPGDDVDRVLAQGDGWIEAEWRVPSEGDLFRGDERARILPGTTTTEHVVQAGELLIWALRGETKAEEGVPVLTRIRAARFRDMVSPGDVLTTRVELTDHLGAVFKVRGRVAAGERRILDVSLDFAATSALNDLVR